MITPEEIDAAAKELDISIPNVERDYVVGWLISGIFQETTLGDRLVLKGGNGLRKAYLPLTRYSDDLDFSTAGGLDRDQIVPQLNQACRFAAARSGVEFDLDRNDIFDERSIDREKHVYKVRLYFKDFAGQGDHITLKVRVDLTEHDRLHLPAQVRNLIHQYSDAAECAVSVRVIQLEEALADKLKCLIQRRSSFDLFDTVYAVFIANELAVDRHEIVRVFLRKTIFERSPGVAKNLLLGVPFDAMGKYWGKIVCPPKSRFSFAHAVERLTAGLEDLFAPFGYGQMLERAFFPAELRNPILEAGGNRRLLELRYHGVTRLIEPYALTFKRRKDGVAQEYFYGWDRTGGRRSLPGIKSFLAPDVAQISVTDQPFEPRFEIELAKAGDADSSGYFTGTTGRRLIPSRRRFTISSSMPYTLECPVCGKRFPRKVYSTKLNAHKDRYGNRCFGRIGSFV